MLQIEYLIKKSVVTWNERVGCWEFIGGFCDSLIYAGQNSMKIVK